MICYYFYEPSYNLDVVWIDIIIIMKLRSELHNLKQTQELSLTRLC